MELCLLVMERFCISVALDGSLTEQLRIERQWAFFAVLHKLG